MINLIIYLTMINETQFKTLKFHYMNHYPY